MEYFKPEDVSRPANVGMQQASHGLAMMSRATERTITREDGGVKWGELAMGLGQAAMGIYSQVKENNMKNKATEFMLKMDQNPEWKPDYNTMSTDEYKAFNLARMQKMDLLRNEATYKKTMMETKKLEYDAKHAALAEEFGAGNALWSSNRKEALKHYEKAYEAVADGYDVTFSEDGLSYTLKGPDGKTEEPVRFSSTDALKSHLDNLYQQVARPEDFAKTHLGVEAQIESDNSRVLLNPIVMVDAKGNRALRYSGFRDKKTGKMLPDKYEINGEFVDEKEIKSAGFVDLKTAEAEQKLEKGEAEITNLGLTGGKIKADTGEAGARAGLLREQSAAVKEDVKKTKAETEKIAAETERIKKEGEAEKTGEDLKNASSQYKLAYAIHKVFPDIPMNQALPFVLEQEGQDAKLKIISSMLAQNGGDFEAPEIKEAIKNLGLKEILAPKASLEERRQKGKGLKPEKGTVSEAQVYEELKKQFPDAPPGTKKYLGNNEFTKQANGAWIRTK